MFLARVVDDGAEQLDMVPALGHGDSIGINASHGVRDRSAAPKMIGAGATRIGTSGAVALAKYLGPGPLPLRDLLASVHPHGDTCVSCSLPAPSASSSGQGY